MTVDDDAKSEEDLLNRMRKDNEIYQRWNQITATIGTASELY
jgi:hypothetical protein